MRLVIMVVEMLYFDTYDTSEDEVRRLIKKKFNEIIDKFNRLLKKKEIL